MVNFAYKYFSTFASGLEPIVEEVLKSSIGIMSVDLLLDGLVVYSCNASPNQIKNIRIFNNSFVLIRLFTNNKVNSIEKMMGAIIKDGIRPSQRLFPNIKTFRVVTSKENQSVPINPKLMADSERLISKVFGMRPDRSKPQTQFWFLTRSEGHGFFGMRLTQHPDYGKVLERGELRPEITNILCLLSEPTKNDIFLDPFAGSGAIAKERVKFPYAKIYSGDISPKNSQIQKMDATKLDTISDESIDKIVTDPPWGLFNEKIDVSKLYTEMLESFYRVLRNNGIAVILVGDRSFFETLLEKFKVKFTLKQKLYILVSGKKAGVYKLVKN